MISTGKRKASNGERSISSLGAGFHMPPAPTVDADVMVPNSKLRKSLQTMADCKGGSLLAATVGFNTAISSTAPSAVATGVGDYRRPCSSMTFVVSESGAGKTHGFGSVFPAAVEKTTAALRQFLSGPPEFEDGILSGSAPSYFHENVAKITNPDTMQGLFTTMTAFQPVDEYGSLGDPKLPGTWSRNSLVVADEGQGFMRMVDGQGASKVNELWDSKESISRATQGRGIETIHNGFLNVAVGFQGDRLPSMHQYGNQDQLVTQGLIARGNFLSVTKNRAPREFDVVPSKKLDPTKEYDMALLTLTSQVLNVVDLGVPVTGTRYCDPEDPASNHSSIVFNNPRFADEEAVTLAVESGTCAGIAFQHPSQYPPDDSGPHKNLNLRSDALPMGYTPAKAAGVDQWCVLRSINGEEVNHVNDVFNTVAPLCAFQTPTTIFPDATFEAIVHCVAADDTIPVPTEQQSREQYGTFCADMLSKIKMSHPGVTTVNLNEVLTENLQFAFGLESHLTIVRTPSSDDDEDEDHQDPEVNLCNCEIIGICEFKAGHVHWVTTFEVETVEAWNDMFDTLSSNSIIDCTNCDIFVIGFLRDPCLNMTFQRVSQTYQQLVLYDEENAARIDQSSQGSAARKYLAKNLQKLGSATGTQCMIDLSIKVYDGAFSDSEIRDRVGFTNEHIMKIIKSYHKLLHDRFSEGKSGDSDLLFGGHGSTPIHSSICFEPSLDNVLAARELVNHHQKVYDQILKASEVETTVKASEVGTTVADDMLLPGVSHTVLFQVGSTEDNCEKFKSYVKKLLTFNFGGDRVSSASNNEMHKHTKFGPLPKNSRSHPHGSFASLIFLSRLLSMGLLKEVKADNRGKSPLKVPDDEADTVLVPKYVWKRYLLADLTDVTTPTKEEFLLLLAQFEVTEERYNAVTSLKCDDWRKAKTGVKWTCTQEDYDGFESITELGFPTASNITSVCNMHPYLIGDATALPDVIATMKGTAGMGGEEILIPTAAHLPARSAGSGDHIIAAV